MDKSKIQAAESNAFFIKSNYTVCLQPMYFTDRTEIIYQPHVYLLAAHLAEMLNCRYLIDIGCGTAGKLVEHHPKFEIIGIDHGENLEQCRSRYPFGTWIDHNLESPDRIDLPEEVVRHAVIICADVIEHLLNPGLLLSKIKGLLQDAPVCVLSTPERDLVRGEDHAGPPPNVAHVREWNREEMKQLVAHLDLHPLHVSLTASDNQDWNKHTMLCLLTDDRFVARDPGLSPETIRSVVEKRLAQLEQRKQ